MRQANQGFTTIELMTVVAIMAILVALAAPSFNGLIERWRVRDTAEAITSTMYYARSEAIKRGGGVTINATGGWNTGWRSLPYLRHHLASPYVYRPSSIEDSAFCRWLHRHRTDGDSIDCCDPRRLGGPFV